MRTLLIQREKNEIMIGKIFILAFTLLALITAALIIFVLLQGERGFAALAVGLAVGWTIRKLARSR